MRLEDLEGRAAISVPEAGALLTLSRDASYAAARSGVIPTIRAGRRLVVPVAAFLRLLNDPTHSESPGANPGSQQISSGPIPLPSAKGLRNGNTSAV